MASCGYGEPVRAVARRRVLATDAIYTDDDGAPSHTIRNGALPLHGPLGLRPEGEHHGFHGQQRIHVTGYPPARLTDRVHARHGLFGR